MLYICTHIWFISRLFRGRGLPAAVGGAAGHGDARRGGGGHLRAGAHGAPDPRLPRAELPGARHGIRVVRGQQQAALLVIKLRSHTRHHAAGISHDSDSIMHGDFTHVFIVKM